MRPLTPLGLLTAALFVMFCLPAQAVLVTERSDESAFFEGDGCRMTDTATVVLPAGARRIQPVTPQVGHGVADPEDGSIVARISSIERLRLGGNVALRYTAVGSDTACAEEVASSGWAAAVELVVRYRRSVRVYMAGTDNRERIRPRIVYIGASQRIYGLRWRSWNGRVARARGIFPFNSCVPDCASGRITSFPVRVTLSSPRRCGSRYRYLRLTWTYAGRKPPRVPRTGSTTFGYQC